MNNVKKRRPLRRHRPGSIKSQICGIAPHDKREWQLDEVNVNSFRTLIGQLNVEAGYSKYGLRTYSDYGTMVITNYG
jgi:hypothetical protein